MHPQTRTPGDLRAFFSNGKSAKNPMTQLITRNCGWSCRTRIREKILKTSTNRNVDDLLDSALQRTLFWQKTLKTSMITTSAKNWNVHVLLELRHAVDVEPVVLGAGLFGVGCSGTSPCSTSRTHAPALANFCPRGAAWWLHSARAVATLIRAYLK